MGWQCEKCGELNDEAVHQSCWKCERSRFGSSDAAISNGLEQNVFCSTTMTIPGRDILESKGVVFGEAILGTNVFRDIMASVRDVVGGRSGAYESKLREGRQIAINEMIQEALGMGADAVIGIDVDYESMGQNMMMMVCASGTAVKLKPIS
jgi:uncharacterized protein YbjQ (UPF0145 family)